MRPCDQCGSPVENKDLVCADCEKFNSENGIKTQPKVSISPFDPATQKPVPLDQSVNLMAISFAGCCVVCFGSAGLQIAGWPGCLVGVLIGLLSGLVFPVMYR